MEKLIYILTVAFMCISAVHADESSSDRIANGFIAASGQFPYAVSLQRAVGTGDLLTRGHVCGGVLVNLQHFLTAGHCTFNYVQVDNNLPVLAPIIVSQYRVFAGTILTNDASPNVTRTIANYTLHPTYSGAPAYRDNIAIVKLITPFLASEVTPLPLPASNFRPADNTLCTVAGWGAIQPGSMTPSIQLWFANKHIYNQNQCTAFYNSLVGYPSVLTTTVCASSASNSGTAGCWGDEGNALVCDGTLTGILFFTNDCYGSYPEIYTRVSNYTVWIRELTGSAPTFKPAAITLVLFTIIHVAFQKILVE